MGATEHRLVLGDSRRMPDVADGSVHAVVTSPPYFDLVEYNPGPSQLGSLASYEAFLDSLDEVWRGCWRALGPGGNLACVVGDVCRSRGRHGRHEVIPLHADVLVRLRRIGFVSVATVFWHKVANARTEAGSPSRAAMLGRPYQPNGVVKNDVEFVLRLRKPGDSPGCRSGYRNPTEAQRRASRIPKREYVAAMRQVWDDIPGERRGPGHPAPFPLALAMRLVRMSSFAGDVVLDPFLGTGTTTLAAALLGRSSVGYEVDNAYLDAATGRLAAALPPGAVLSAPSRGVFSA